VYLSDYRIREVARKFPGRERGILKEISGEGKGNFAAACRRCPWSAHKSDNEVVYEVRH
jgi:hypothetical protein